MKRFRCRPFFDEDLEAVSRIHMECFPAESYLNSFGGDVVALYYREMLHCGLGVVAIREEGTVVGYVCGCRNYKRFINNFILKNYSKLVGVLFMDFRYDLIMATLKRLPMIIMKNITEKISGRSKEFRLLAIAVDKNVRGFGVGKELIKEFESRLISEFRDIDSVGLFVERSNVGAFTLYEKLGFSVSKNTKRGYFMRKSLMKDNGVGTIVRNCNLR